MTDSAKRTYGSGGITWLTTTGTSQGSCSRRNRTADQGRPCGSTGPRRTWRGCRRTGDFARDVELERTRAEPVVRTLGDLMDAYVEHCRRTGKRQGTIASYGMTTKRLTPTLEAEPIDKLTAHDLDQFYGELAKTFSANSIRQTNAVLRAALAQAVKWGWIVANPTAGATPRPSSSPSAKRSPWRT